MDPATQEAAELQILRTLCDEAVSRERRLDLLQSYGLHFFIGPEHQAVFESINRLLPCGLISATRLTAHLNNRGFPDIDIDRYFPAIPADRAAHGSADQTKPVRSNE